MSDDAADKTEWDERFRHLNTLSGEDYWREFRRLSRMVPDVIEAPKDDPVASNGREAVKAVLEKIRREKGRRPGGHRA